MGPSEERYPGLHVHLHHQEVRYSTVERFSFLRRSLCCFAYAKPLINVTVATWFISSSSKHSYDWRKNLTHILWIYYFVHLVSSWCVHSELSIYICLPQTSLFQQCWPIPQYNFQKLKQLPSQCPLSALYWQEPTVHILKRRNGYVNFGCYSQTMYRWMNCTLSTGTDLPPRHYQEFAHLLL